MNRGNNWLKPARIFFALLSRRFESIKTKQPPRKHNLQWLSTLHQRILAVQNARGLLELNCVTGVIFPYIGLRMGGGYSPLSQIRKSPLSLDFIVGEAVKIFLPHLQGFLLPAVPNSWEKPGVFSLPSVTRALPSPRLGRWEPGLLLLPAAGRLAGAASKSIRGRLVQVTHLHPSLRMRVLSSLLLVEVLWQSSSTGENRKCYYGRR